MNGAHAAAPDVAAEDQLRANTYALLAVLLRSEPDEQLLGELRSLPSDDSEMGQGLAALAEAAGGHSVETASDEYHALFIGLGDAPLKPYASYYLTGFLHEKPLANLRVAMGELGIERAEGVAEPEDHIAALCEIMYGLITGAFGEQATLDRQRAFFDAHIAPWAERFFDDLEVAPGATLYGPVGTVGRLFMRIESQSFEMAA